MDLALESAVVVGEAVELEVFDEPVESDRYPGGPGEIVLVDGVVEGEDRTRERDAFGGLLVRHGGDPDPQVVEFEDFDVSAELGGDQRHVGGDIEHPGVEVAHQPV